MAEEEQDLTEGNFEWDSTEIMNRINVLVEDDEDYMQETEVLASEEVLQRRIENCRKLARLYRTQYWALTEELRSKHRQFYIKNGHGGWNESATDPQRKALGLPAEYGQTKLEPQAPGRPASATLHCAAAGPCLRKPLALTGFCFDHILLAPRQKLYKPCSFTQSPGGPQCGHPVLCAVKPLLCHQHQAVVQKQAKKRTASQGTSLQNDPLPAIVPSLRAKNLKFHHIITEYVRQIQHKRRRLCRTEAFERLNPNPTPIDLTSTENDGIDATMNAQHVQASGLNNGPTAPSETPLPLSAPSKDTQQYQQKPNPSNPIGLLKVEETTESTLPPAPPEPDPDPSLKTTPLPDSNPNSLTAVGFPPPQEAAVSVYQGWPYPHPPGFPYNYNGYGYSPYAGYYSPWTQGQGPEAHVNTHPSSGAQGFVPLAGNDEANGHHFAVNPDTSPVPPGQQNGSVYGWQGYPAPPSHTQWGCNGVYGPKFEGNGNGGGSEPFVGFSAGKGEDGPAPSNVNQFGLPNSKKEGTPPPPPNAASK